MHAVFAPWHSKVDARAKFVLSSRSGDSPAVMLGLQARFDRIALAVGASFVIVGCHVELLDPFPANDAAGDVADDDEGVASLDAAEEGGEAAGEGAGDDASSEGSPLFDVIGET